MDKNVSGHMTKLAAMPLYDKKPLKNFRTRSLMIMVHSGLKVYKVYINNPGLTLAYFMAR